MSTDKKQKHVKECDEQIKVAIDIYFEKMSQELDQLLESIKRIYHVG